MILTRIKSSPLFAVCSVLPVPSLLAQRKTIRNGWKPFLRFTALPPRYGNVTDAGRKSGVTSARMNAKWSTAPERKASIFVWNVMNTLAMNYVNLRNKGPIGLSCGKPRNGSRTLDMPDGLRKWLSIMPVPNAGPSTPPTTSSAGHAELNPVVPMLTDISMKFSLICRKRSKPEGKNREFIRPDLVLSRPFNAFLFQCNTPCHCI